MDEYLSHWESTLMGWKFWKDAAEHEEQLRKTFETSLDPNLHKRFPFNLIPEQTPRVQEETTTPKRRSRLSVSDTRGATGIRRHASMTLAPPRFRGLGRYARSASPTKHSAPGTPVIPWSPLLAPVKAPDETKDTTVETVEVPPSPSLSSTTHVPVGTWEIATPTEPLMNFRGGIAWETLPRDKKMLGLDLFWPCPPDSEEVDCLDIMEIKPLCQFRGLRSLKIVGMLQSYQTYIWQAAWLNLNLDELELGMALQPEVVNPTYSMKWHRIQHRWEMDPTHRADPVYYGYRGKGGLHPHIGRGEYFDKQSMEMAKIRALAMGQTCKLLTIKKLTLSGFVVDADPFIHWFDPSKLRSIHFKGQCVDSGFWLPPSMASVSVRVPRPIDLEAVPAGILRLNLRKDLKVVDLQCGNKISETSFRGWENITRQT